MSGTIAMKGKSIMDRKIVSISSKRQITIPQKFFTTLGFTDEAECMVRGNELVIRPARVSTGGEFAEHILAELIAEGLSGNELLTEFKAKQAKIRPAVEAMIKEAEEVATGNGEYSTYDDIFGAEDNVLPVIPENVPVLTVTKGLMDTEDGKLITYPDIWQKKLDSIGKKLSLNAIGGPCTSYELVAHDQTEVAFCGNDIETLKYLKQLMQTDYYHISITTEVTGIESAVALKNGYALGIALTIGLNQKSFGNDELHFNSQAAVFGQAAKEMYKLLQFQDALTLNNLCVGVGDLYVTVYGGRTRLVGILLGKGLNIDEAKAELNGVTLESLVVAERVARAVKLNIEKGILNKEDFPLLLHIDEIICGKKEVNIPWESFTYES